MKNIVIAIAAPKGGVGKTTTSVNIAVGLAKKGKKTLLIDADPSSYCSSAFGYCNEKMFGNLVDLYKHTKNIHEVIHRTELPNLEIVPFEKMNYEQEVIFNRLSSNKKVLSEAIEDIKIDYNYIIIDCPPTLYGNTINTLLISDYLIVPVKSSSFSLEAADKMIKLVNSIKEKDNPGLTVDGLLLTMYESNTKASFYAKKILFDRFPNLMFKTSIPKNSKVAESTFFNQPLILFDENATASKAYKKLVDELIDRHETSHLMALSGFDHTDFLDEEISNHSEHKNLI